MNSLIPRRLNKLRTFWQPGSESWGGAPFAFRDCDKATQAFSGNEAMATPNDLNRVNSGAEYGPNCIESEVVAEGMLHSVDRVAQLSATDLVAQLRSAGARFLTLHHDSIS